MTFVEETLITMAIYVVLASSFDLIIGCGGMFSIAHAAFFALGAYTVALLTVKVDMPILLTWVIGALACAILSMLLAAIAVRVTSDYLIIASFGFLSIVLAFFTNSGSLTGGFIGISGVPFPSFFGIEIQSYLSFVVAYVLIAAVAVTLLLYVSRSPFGRSLKAIRDNQLAAEALGKRPTYSKVWVFSIAGAFAGIAGAMYASFISYVSPDAFGNSINVLIFAMVFVGGAGTIAGAVIGAVVLTWIPALISLVPLPASTLGDFEQAAYGLVLVLIVMLMPGGLVGGINRGLASVRQGSWLARGKDGTGGTGPLASASGPPSSAVAGRGQQ
jgi:branched-chain amino acid transport system permease protein